MSRDRRLRDWLWPVLIPLVVIIYLLTNNIVLASLIPSIGAALPALRSGFWIYRNEIRISTESRYRATTLLLCYVACACWQAAASAVVSVLGLVVLAQNFGRQPDMTRFSTLMLVIVLGVIATTLLGLTALTLAWRNCVKLWIHPKVFRWCEGNYTLLPSGVTPYRHRFNFAVFILGTSFVFPGLVVGTVVLIALTATGQALNDTMQWISFAVMAVFFIGYPIVAMVGYATASKRIVAATPAECWTA